MSIETHNADILIMGEDPKEPSLKPCPFCGGMAIMTPYTSKGFVIRCTKCPAKMTQKVLRKSLEWLKVAMLEDWNKRIES